MYSQEKSKRLLEAIYGDSAMSRRRAIREIKLLSGEELLQIMELEANHLWQEQKQVSEIARIVAIGVGIFGLVFFLFTLFVLPISGPKALQGQLFALFWTLCAPFLVYNAIVQRDKMQLKGYGQSRSSAHRLQAHQEFLAALKLPVGDPRFLDLAMALLPEAIQDTPSRNALSPVLRNGLPLLRADQALTSKQKAGLLAVLEDPYMDVELTLCVLQALEQVGDESYLPALDRLLDDGAATPNMKRVQQAARKCRRYLSRNADQLKQAQTLLRASDAETIATPNVLLRPATTGVSVTPPPQLLRPAEAGAECNISLSEGTDSSNTVPVEAEEVRILRG